MSEDSQAGPWEVLRPYDPLTGDAIHIRDVGNGYSEIRRTFYHTDALLDLNAERRNSEDGKGWGNGKVVASIPLNLMFSLFTEAMRDGDQQYIAKTLNNIDYSKLRTKNGRL